MENGDDPKNLPWEVGGPPPIISVPIISDLSSEQWNNIGAVMGILSVLSILFASSTQILFTQSQTRRIIRPCRDMIDELLATNFNLSHARFEELRMEAIRSIHDISCEFGVSPDQMEADAKAFAEKMGLGPKTYGLGDEGSE